MEIIAELEADARGVYSGRGRLRRLQRRHGHLHRAADAGLTRMASPHCRRAAGSSLDSTPDGEYAESFHKMRGAGSGDRAGRVDRERGGSGDDSADRQLRFVHLQPLPVSRASWAPRSRSSATTRSRSMRSGRGAASSTDRHLARTVHAGRGGHLRAAGPAAGGRGADPRRLPRSPVDRRGVRRRRSSRADA